MSMHLYRYVGTYFKVKIKEGLEEELYGYYNFLTDDYSALGYDYLYKIDTGVVLDYDYCEAKEINLHTFKMREDHGKDVIELLEICSEVEPKFGIFSYYA